MAQWFLLVVISFLTVVVFVLLSFAFSCRKENVWASLASVIVSAILIFVMLHSVGSIMDTALFIWNDQFIALWELLSHTMHKTLLFGTQPVSYGVLGVVLAVISVAIFLTITIMNRLEKPRVEIQ